MDWIDIHAACPPALFDAGNHFGMAMGGGAAEGLTYHTDKIDTRDSDGHPYQMVLLRVRADWVSGVLSGAAMVAPDWDADGIVDMSLAAQARAAMVFPSADGGLPTAAPDRIAVIVGGTRADALAAMGLTPVPVEI